MPSTGDEISETCAEGLVWVFAWAAFVTIAYIAYRVVATAWALAHPR